MTIIHRSIALTLLTLVAAACDGRQASRPSDLAELPGLEIDEQPTLVLADDGTDEKLFSRMAARRMPNGDIAVADQGTATIHVFGRDGRVVRTLARRGDGPGELKGAFVLAASADTLYTFGQPPMSAPDVSVFAATTGFVSRSRPATDSIRMLTVVDRLTTGELVVQRGMDMRVLDRPPDVGRLVPDTMTYGLFSGASAVARSRVVWLPAVVRAWRYGFPWPGSVIGSGLGSYELGPRVMMVASGDRVWLVDGGSGELRAFDGSGGELVTSRVSLTARPFDRVLLERRRARALAAAGRALDSAKIEAMYDPGIRPSTMPLLSSAHAGPDGGLWVRLFELDESAPQRFVVVNDRGSEVAHAVLPAGYEVQHVGRDFVLGVRHDSLGVPMVVEYAIHGRPAR